MTRAWFGILVATIAAASTSQAAVDEARRAMDVTQEACDAWRDADVAALERTLAPTFTLVSSTSRMQSRETVIAEVRAGETTYAEFRNHDMVAHVYGRAATVQGITSLKGMSGGQAFAIDVRFTDTLVKSGGRWRIVVSHVTRIPAP